jgi:ATP adenylyltransferase
VSAAETDGRRPLWAPWRVEYVGTVGGERRCIFCEPADPEGRPVRAPESDRSRLIVHRGRHSFVLLNRYPYASGHLMVAPYRHAAKLYDLEPEERAELLTRLGDCERILEKLYHCEGMNVGANIGTAAGAGFADHLHFHLVPRWSGDVNFMTAVGEIRVIPEHLERAYDELAAAFAALERR